MRSGGLVAAVTLIGVIGYANACSRSSSSGNATAVNSSRADTNLATGFIPIGWVLSREGLGPIQFCTPLDSVASVFPSVQDTTFRSEGDRGRWPAKVVHLPDSETIVFESAWNDTLRLSTIRATSRSVKTKKGYGPGTTFGTLIAAGESLLVEVPEGVLVLTLEPDQVALRVDKEAEDAFYQHDGSPQVAMINPAARIIAIAAGHGCANTSSN